MADDEPLDELARWLVDQRAEIDIEGHISLTKKDTAEGKRTVVAIDHLVSCPLPGRAGWRVRTKRTYLPPTHFHSSAAHPLKTADHNRGRTIYCMDRGLDGEVVAGLSYHLDERRSWPLFVTAIGFRIDFPDNAVLRRRTLRLRSCLSSTRTPSGRFRDAAPTSTPKSRLTRSRATPKSSAS